jgi:gonadotropin-releasing hormone receptor
MIEDSHLVQSHVTMSNDSELDLVTAVVMTENITLPPDMVFNEGSRLSIIVYRYYRGLAKLRGLQNKIIIICSILMVISAFGNITVFTILLRRRLRTPSRLDIMLMHLAVADLMVSLAFSSICSIWVEVN